MQAESGRPPPFYPGPAEESPALGELSATRSETGSTGAARVPLLRTRYEPPAYGFTPVETRVLRSFRSGPLTKVTLVIAPTGFGKTVLMTQLHGLISGRGGRCVWVGLDDRRIDLPALLTHIETALRLDALEDEVPLVLDPRGNTAARIDRIVEALGSGPGDTALFLDNMNACDDPGLAQLMDALVFRSGRFVHVIASSTRPIEFDVGRARVEMKLRRLTPMELGFNHHDTEAVLREAGLDNVSRETVAAIVGRTEGWPAAVRLMQLILAGEDGDAGAIEGFTGADSDFAALLSRRLMDTFDPELVAFLSDIAVLSGFSAELAEVATGNPNAAAWIRYLVERNVLIVPLNRERTWFRFHALFREFLLSETGYGGEGLTAQRQAVATRAARWLSERGEYAPALDLALSAADRRLVESLLEAMAQPMVRDRGELAGFVDLVRRASACGAELGVEALPWYAWAQAFTRDYGGARSTLKRLAERIPERPGTEVEADRLRLRQRMAEIIVSFHLDDLAKVRDWAPDWLAAAEEIDRPFDRAAVAAALSLAAIADHDFKTARHAIREIESAIIRTLSDYGRAWACLVAATADIAQGDPAGAERRLRAIDGPMRARLGGEDGIVAVLALMEARAAADLGRTSEALDLIRRWMPRAVENGILEILWFAMEVAVDALLTDEAPFDLDVLRAFAARFGPRLTFLLDVAVMRRRLRMGACDVAAERLERAGLIGKDGQPVMALPATLTAMEVSAARMAQIALALAAGKWRQAEILTGEALQRATQEGRRREQVELHLEQAALAQRSGNAPAARMAFVKAVTLAARHGLLRPFLQQREIVRAVIAGAPLKKFGLSHAADLAVFQTICTAAEASPAGAETGAGLPVDAATPREVELLRLLDAGYDNAQIAAALSLSVPTVKWHLSNIYSKLGVNKRSAALIRARDLRLLT